MTEEKQTLLESLEKKIKAKQTELSNTILEIKSKIKLLEDLNEIANTKDDNVLLTKLQTQQEMLLIGDKQIHALQQNIEVLNATRIDPLVFKEREDKIKELEAHITELNTEISELKSVNNALQSKNHEEEINLTKIKLQFQDKEKKLLNDIEVLKQQMGGLSASFANLEKENEEMTAQKDKYREKKKQRKLEIKELQEKVAALLNKEMKSGSIVGSRIGSRAEIKAESKEDVGEAQIEDINKPDSQKELERIKEKENDGQLQEEFEYQMKAVSDLHRANIRLDEELEEMMKKYRKAKKKTKQYKQMLMKAEKGEVQLNSTSGIEDAKQSKSQHPEENEEHQHEEDEQLQVRNEVEEPKHSFTSGQPNQALKEELAKLREKQHSDRQKRKKYKKHMKEFEEKHNELMKIHSLSQEKEKNEREQALAELHQQLEKCKGELANWEHKHAKSKQKTKKYKSEQHKWKELYDKIPQKLKESPSEEVNSDKETQTPTGKAKVAEQETLDNWNEREKVFKDQTEQCNRVIETKELEIDGLKKQIHQMNIEQDSSTRSAIEEIEQLKQQLIEADTLGKEYEEYLEEKDKLIKELEENIVRLEELNKELEQHVEDVDEKIELANTQMLEMQQQLHEKDQAYSAIITKNNEFLEQKMKQAVSKITVLQDTLTLKEDSLKKKDEFNSRLLEEVDKLKKKLSAANSKIQYELKGQMTDAEKKLKDKDIEIKILKDMVQSTKTMLRVRDNEVMRLNHKNYVAEASGINLEADQHIEKEPELHVSTQVSSMHQHRGLYRSTDARVHKSSVNLPRRSQNRVDYSKFSNPEEDTSVTTPYLNTDGIATDERHVHVRKRSDFLPSIEKSGPLRDNSFSKQRDVHEMLSNPIGRGNSTSTAKLQQLSIKEHELRQILGQANDEGRRNYRSGNSQLRANHNVFDPNNPSDYKFQSEEAQMHISPVRVTQKKKENFKQNPSPI